MAEELATVEPQDMAVFEESEDPSLVAVIALPGYDSVSDQKVLKSVRDIFKGFDYDSSGIKFADMDQLAVYTQDTMEDIRRVRKTAVASQLCQKAAIMARFWYLGATIDKALQNGDYGTGAVNKLAAALHKSIPYIYQIRAVATRLTAVDCYLLGMRDLDSTHLRKLAQVKDDATRRSIIAAFIDMVKDTSDSAKVEQAKKQLVSALNADQQSNAIDVGTSDPLNGGSEVAVTPEWQAAMRCMDDWSRMLRKPSGDEPIEELCNALAEFFITDRVPDAQLHLQELKDKATALKALMQAVKNNLDDAIQELDSVCAAGVTQAEK